MYGEGNPDPDPVSTVINYLQIYSGRSEDFDILAGPNPATPEPVLVSENFFFADEDVGIELTRNNEQAFVILLKYEPLKRTITIKYFTFSHNRFGNASYIITRGYWYACFRRFDEPPISDNYTGNSHVRFYNVNPAVDNNRLYPILTMDATSGFTTVEEAAKYNSQIDIRDNIITFDLQGPL